MRKIPVFAFVFMFSLFSSSVYAQNFSFGLDLPLFGVVDNSNNQLAVGAGLSAGLNLTESVRVGAGFGVVDYPGRPKIKVFDNTYKSVVVEEFKDDADLIFTASTGFRVHKFGHEFPAVYVTVLYMRAMTAKNFPGLGKVNNGVLMGFTFANK